VLRSIEEHDHVSIDAFVGASFGAVRWAYDSGRYRWAILIRPYPIDVSGTAILRERARLIDDQQPPAPVDAAIRGDSVLADRSIPLVPLDGVSARVFAAERAEALTSRDIVGLDADLLWQRYGTDSISPALLAYWQEVCGTTTDWPMVEWDGTVADTTGFLASFHRPCQGIEAKALGPRYGGDHVCVVVGDRDSVTPGALSRLAFEALSATIVASDLAPHVVIDGLSTCISRVAA
jgi:hypothetical protein